MAQTGARIGLLGLTVAFLHSTALAAIEEETGRWTFGIGDPTIFGWLTVCAYVAAGVLAALNARAAWRRHQVDWFWVALTGVCFLLAINKQLDLQSWLTQWGRDMAIAQGWYEQRRVMQKGLIFLLAFLGAIASALMWIRLAGRWRHYRLAAVGVVLLICFVIVRAATFHHVDRFLSVQVGGLRTNVVFELTAIALIALGAVQWRRARALGQ